MRMLSRSRAYAVLEEWSRGAFRSAWAASASSQPSLNLPALECAVGVLSSFSQRRSNRNHGKGSDDAALRSRHRAFSRRMAGGKLTHNGNRLD